MSNPNPSLQKKTAARMAAVQCLYQQAITGDVRDAASQAAALKAQLKDNRSEQKMMVGMPVEPQYAMLEAMLAGVAERLDEINMRLDGSLSEKWTRNRMSPLLVALLQCGIFEMFFYKEISPKIVIDEYTRLARSFFADNEVDFVHGALATLAKAYG